MTDQPQSLDDLLREHKRCPRCGQNNRLAAKVCVNCGFRFPADSIRADETIAAASPVVAAKASGKPIRAKTCPDCGTINDLDAKFCPMCAHRFSTDFSKTPVSTDKPAIKSAEPPPGEPPIVQMPSTGTVLVTTPAPPVILPPSIKPPQKSLKPGSPVPVPPVDSTDATPEQAAPVDPNSVDGAPAPDLTDVDLARLRRRDRRY